MVPDWAQVAVVREQGSRVFVEEWRGRMQTTGQRRWLARRTSSRGEGRRRVTPRTPSSSPRRLAGRLVAPPRPHLLCARRGAASASTPTSCFLPPCHHTCRSTRYSSILPPLSATVARTSLVWAWAEGHGESCASGRNSRGLWSVEYGRRQRLREGRPPEQQEKDLESCLKWNGWSSPLTKLLSPRTVAIWWPGCSTSQHHSILSLVVLASTQQRMSTNNMRRDSCNGGAKQSYGSSNSQPTPFLRYTGDEVQSTVQTSIEYSLSISVSERKRGSHGLLPPLLSSSLPCLRAAAVLPRCTPLLLPKHGAVMVLARLVAASSRPILISSGADLKVRSLGSKASSSYRN